MGIQIQSRPTHTLKASFALINGAERDSHRSNWALLSLDLALDIVDQTAELPSNENFISILQKCKKEKNLEYAQRLYTHVCNNGLEAHMALGNYIVPMFVDCGSVHHAQHIFNRLAHQNVHSWTSLMAGYIQCGQSIHALNMYEKMQEDGVPPNKYTVIALLKACTKLKDAERGRMVHMEILGKGLDGNIFVGSALVDMYAKCGLISEAQRVFDQLPVKDVVSWTALVAGYAEHELYEDALKSFELMQLEGISPNAVTFVCMLKACGAISATDLGREIHHEIKKLGLERDIFVGNALINMYTKCGSLSEAQEVFDKLQVRDVVSWTALIEGYVEHGPKHEALNCFEQMKLEGIVPDAIAFICVLKACGSMRAINKGRELHAEIIRKGFERDPFVGSMLMDMYVKCGSLSEAQGIFDKLPGRDVVSWSTLIAGYAEHGSIQDALKYFGQMQLEGVSPNVVTFVSLLKACGSSGAIEKGRDIHMDITEKDLMKDPNVGNTLIDMYAKCGSLLEAREVFDKLPVRDVVSWISMINGYGMNYEGNMAVQCFEDMQEQGVTPDAVTFTCLLTACSRARMAFKGQKYFKLMKEKYGVVPTPDHYTCMVDLLARSGQLHEAEKFLENVPGPPSVEPWIALLSACKIYGEAELGLRCYQQLVQINPEIVPSYVIMANIYANAGKRHDACQVEESRKFAGAKKKPASALIEVNKMVHEFVVCNNQNKEISAMLQFLNSRMEQEGHRPNLDMVLRPVSDEEKEVALCEHAEKLALAFGLLNTPHGKTLRVTKNMRVCNNCHDANKVLSKIESREIIVRDSYCVHHFKDGSCSCTPVL